MMIELTSTPIIIMVILGIAGMIIPVINVVRKEQGSSTFYGLIAFGALLLSLGYVIYRFYTCLLYTSPSPRDATLSRMPSSA